MSILDQFKGYVSEQYQAILSLKLTEDVTATSSPVWLADGNQAWLLDDEIGLAMRVIPYNDAQDDLNAAIQHSIRTATQLQPRYGIIDSEADSSGIWQVSICWLVVASLGEDWRNAISNIRKESGFSEEVGLDAILVNKGEDIVTACMRQSLPQLLLHSRRIFKRQWDEMPGWLSANVKVAEMLQTFPSQYSGDIETYKLAIELVADVLPEDISDLTATTTKPNKILLEEIEIKNFRNINHTKLNFKDKNAPTQAHVIFGPNGTGKTSIFEALYLATGGVSNTLVEYLNDPDIDARKRDYSTSVLAPLTDSSPRKPVIILNNTEKNAFQSATKEQAPNNLLDMEGTFQAQEDTRNFLGIKGQDLAQRILKNYSTLADEVIKHAETRAWAAKNEKSEWLKIHGLSAQISIRETRAKRLIEIEMQKEPWLPSQSLMDWLEKTTRFFPDVLNDGQRIAARWYSWREGQDDCINRMAQGISIGETSVIRQPLATWLSTRNKLLEDTRNLVNRASTFIEPLRNQLQGVENELDAWGEWLIRQANQQASSAGDEQILLIQQIEQTRQRLAELRQQYSLARKHKFHLEQLQKDLFPDWIKSQPDICPTCGENHHDKGGIENVVDIIKTDVEGRLANYEQEGKTFNAMLAEKEAKLASFGVCPVSEKHQTELRNLLAPFCTVSSLQTLLTDRIARTSLKSSVQAAQRLPDVQEPISEPDDAAMQLAERCLALDAEAERLWSLPERWSKIVKSLDSECRGIVEKHLPETMQKLWWEITLNLTPARWNLAATPVFQMKGRASPKLIIGIEKRDDTPARYLFNQAERHIMGLAWFFTRYLTHGRFHRAFVVLDDPAQEMDQTTFRSFARFVQTLLRLHKLKDIPAQMVIFLHQEERALDMARSTLGRLFILSWLKTNNGQEDIREVRLLSEGFKPQTAMQILVQKTSTEKQ